MISAPTPTPSEVAQLPIFKGKGVVEVRQNLMMRVSNAFLLDAHHWLILHGRYTCIARKPLCWNCIIADLCEFKDKTPAPDGV